MIESRYKIEYVLPDEDVKKTSGFRVLWYLLLIPIVLLAVVAITYDFSVQNIVRDSTVLIEKTKVHIFNLGENQQSNKPQKVTTDVLNKTITQRTIKPPLIVQNKEEIKTTEVTLEPESNVDKKTIIELTAQKELHLKSIQQQKVKNTEFSKELDLLSSLLILEQTKNKSLKSKLHQQLNKISIESINNNSKLEDLTKQKEVTNTLISESKDSQIIKNTENLSVKKSKSIEINQVSTDNKGEEKSDTDKIIDAMIAAKSIPSTEQLKNAENTVKEDSQTINVSDTDKAFNVDKKTNNSVDNIEVNEDKVDKTSIVNNSNTKTQKPTSAAVEITKEDKEKAVEVLPIKVEDNVTTATPVTPEPKVKEPPKPSPTVDDIIATMQNAQTNITVDSTDDNNKIDLEKDTKNQLVEKNNISVDN